MAQDEYAAFVTRALFLDQPDPVAAWGGLGAFQERLIARLAGARELRIEAEGTDLRLRVQGRTWVNSDGRRNMPSGEVFTGPHETSAEGNVRFTVRSSPAGVDVDGVELELRAGEVVAARARTGDDYLQRALATDDGARRLGEVGIGTNFGIDRPVGTILFDEKIGGTVHLALGRSYPETGGKNASALHWDLICDLRAGGPADGRRRGDPGGRAVRGLRRPERLRCTAMRRTKIVATIGPASRDRDVLVRMVEAGMDVARLNFSHGTHEQHAETAQLVREAAGRAGRPVAVMQDLPGPKLRIGALRDDSVELRAGDPLTFACGGDEQPGDDRRMWISWPGLATSIEAGDVLYLADGAVRMRVTGVRSGDGEVDCTVEIGGTVASRQGLNVPGPTDQLPAVPEEDLEHLRAGLKIGVDLVALSFVRQPEDVLFVREHTRIPLIAKIEKPQAVERAAGDHPRRRLRDGGPRRPRHRDADRGGADRAEAPDRAGRLDGAAGDHGDADAGLDGRLLPPHARGGRRRRQRHPRRHGRGDALPGDRGRRPPGAGDRGHGRRRQDDRARGALRALERGTRRP